MVVGFQGEAGAFSEAAAVALFGAVKTVGFADFDALVEAVDAGAVDAALIPCENTIYGSIARTYDLLSQYDGLRIVDETTHRITQALMGTPDAQLDRIERITSHPVALEQCRAFLATRSHVAVEAVPDTAGAVRAMMERGDPATAAIGPAPAAERYGAKVLVPNVQDDVENVTRFFAISRDHAPRRDLGRACIALDLPHQAGSLHAALGVAAERGLNLRSLIARPARGRPFHYRFYLELDRPEGATIEALREAFGSRMQLLGSY